VANAGRHIMRADRDHVPYDISNRRMNQSIPESNDNVLLVPTRLRLKLKPRPLSKPCHWFYGDHFGGANWHSVDTVDSKLLLCKVPNNKISGDIRRPLSQSRIEA
jgi:hypothetical protein